MFEKVLNTPLIHSAKTKNKKISAQFLDFFQNRSPNWKRHIEIRNATYKKKKYTCNKKDLARQHDRKCNVLFYFPITAGLGVACSCNFSRSSCKTYFP